MGWIEDRESGVVQHFGTTCAKAPSEESGVGPAAKAERFDDAQRAFWIGVNAEYRRRGGYHLPNPGRRGVFVAADAALKDAIAAELRQAAAGLTAPFRFI